MTAVMCVALGWSVSPRLSLDWGKIVEEWSRREGLGLEKSRELAVVWPGEPMDVIRYCLFRGLSANDYSYREGSGVVPDGFRRHIIVISTLQRSPAPEVLRFVKSLSHPIILLLSDEKLRHATSRYGRKVTIFRNYFRPGWSLQRVLTIPLLPLHMAFVTARGNVRGVERTFDWVFVGQEKNDRAKMAKIFESPQSFLQLTSRFNDVTGGMRPEALADLYAQSTFVLCPHGNVNPDTFRIMEALYCGSIPVVVTFQGIDYYRLIFGNHPFVIANSWEEARALCEKLRGSPTALSQRQTIVEEWFAMFMENLVGDLETVARGGSTRHLRSEQFGAQRLQRWKPRLIWGFWNTFAFKPFVTQIRRNVDGWKSGRG